MRYIVYIRTQATGEVVDLHMFQFRMDAETYMEEIKGELESAGLYSTLEEDRIF